VNGDTVIAKGAEAKGVIVDAAKKRRLLRGIKGTYRLVRADAVDGKSLLLRTTPAKSGETGKRPMVGTVQGSEFPAYVDGTPVSAFTPLDHKSAQDLTTFSTADSPARFRRICPELVAPKMRGDDLDGNLPFKGATGGLGQVRRRRSASSRTAAPAGCRCQPRFPLMLGLLQGLVKKPSTRVRSGSHLRA
jgi:hypothetical protein